MLDSRHERQEYVLFADRATGQAREGKMKTFQNLSDIVETLEADPTTRNDPIKRTFVIDGDHLTANVAVVSGSDNSLHTQASHDELLVIVEGNVAFRVGDEVSQVEPGDLVFIPQATIHGPILEEGQSFAALSVFAPHFDRSLPNIDWDRDS